jgi:hypothetical protein
VAGAASEPRGGRKRAARRRAARPRRAPPAATAEKPQRSAAVPASQAPTAALAVLETK